jgi:rubrerythrin
MDILKIYKYALQREIEGKRFFEQNAERMSHGAATGAFKNLAAEEQKHIDFIQSKIDQIEKKGSPSLETVPEDEEFFFSQRAASEILDRTVLESMVPDLPVLRMAYLIERDFAEFYEKAAAKAEGDAKQVLEKLANWERDHESLFKKYHDMAFEEYAGMPWGG